MNCAILDKKDIEIRNLKIELHNEKQVYLLNIKLTKQIETLCKQEVRLKAALHKVYTLKTTLQDRVCQLETCLSEIKKSPQWRHVPNWVVIKIEEIL